MAASRPAITCWEHSAAAEEECPIRPDRAGPTDLNFPHTQQVVVQRHTTDLTGSNARTELVYALSSQPAHHASPQQLGALARAHWQVEALHWVRDVTFAKTPAASAPPRPPGHGHLRNLAIGLLRLAGHTQITPTLRWVNRNPARALAFSASHEPANTPNPITPRPDGGNLRPREMFSLGVTKEREPSQPRALK